MRTGKKDLSKLLVDISRRYTDKFKEKRKVEDINASLTPCPNGGKKLCRQSTTIDTAVYPFWISNRPVSFYQYAKVMGTLPGGGTPRHPSKLLSVTNIDWFEAMEFCRRLTEKAEKLKLIPEGYEYRLPTLAELALAAERHTLDSPIVEIFNEAHTSAAKRTNLPSEIWCFEWYTWDCQAKGAENSHKALYGVSKVVARGTVSGITKSFESPSAVFATLGFRFILGRKL